MTSSHDSLALLVNCVGGRDGDFINKKSGRYLLLCVEGQWEVERVSSLSAANEVLIK